MSRFTFTQFLDGLQDAQRENLKRIRLPSGGNLENCFDAFSLTSSNLDITFEKFFKYATKWAAQEEKKKAQQPGVSAYGRTPLNNRTNMAPPTAAFTKRTPFLKNAQQYQQQQQQPGLGVGAAGLARGGPPETPAAVSCNDNLFQVDAMSYTLVKGRERDKHPKMERIEKTFNGQVIKKTGREARNKEKFDEKSVKVYNVPEVPYRWMGSTAEDLSFQLNARSRLLAEGMRKKILHAGLKKEAEGEDEDLEEPDVGDALHAPSLLFGRVVCDSEGNLNLSSAVLEGIRTRKGDGIDEFCGKAELQVTDLKNACLFAGQTVAVKSKFSNASGSRIVPYEIVEGRQVEPLMLELQKLKDADKMYNKEPVHMMVAAGPFAKFEDCEKVTARKESAEGPYETEDIPNNASDVLFTQPLHDVLDRARLEAPHILLLLGPFLHSDELTNFKMETGKKDDGTPIYEMCTRYSFAFADERGTELTIKTFYEKYFFEEIRKFCLDPRVKENKTRVLLVPNEMDIGHPWPLPQPPYRVSQSIRDQCPNLRLLSNPAYFEIHDELPIAVTSSLVVSPRAFAWSSVMDPVKRKSKLQTMLGSILRQRTFFPTDPLDVPVEPAYLQRLTVWDPPPGVFICPSKGIPPNGYEVHDRVFVVPPTFTKNEHVGKVAHVFIAPPDKMALETATEEPQAKKVRVKVEDGMEDVGESGSGFDPHSSSSTGTATVSGRAPCAAHRRVRVEIAVPTDEDFE
uniref:DNA polymerase alpha subunit B n=1 Tax=Chromera velia CCMP2878 TaxID=1169474 RepID=A0A0G4I3Y8_9ALVE|mmetsp:Transcript_11135/g.21510  ORF Transcript_11135/g.21510 Transcript_11135/m.21510 type:complete len:740 (+) Transcript_11135:317-2536(+)|eukprot:Cvel_1783.t1-p1 / transcript=Cvel_1783.t1 / gene=Cvel_1783 / organism=Chromera_velia_CCMP2878 / gene_product=DNA polymerase alpha subunit B, putative / transcript_product=DNA polymerase alpha subunit B, putative / location=Cvel_scaffold65:97905-107733(+) / protein_length=739 / sequence_SO=supercontig / SO=protein_coding / is_pseudo=false